MIDNKVVGATISTLRQRRNMTQQALAACLNVSHQAVSKWENGAALPDVLTLLELSRMFGLTLEQLLAGGTDEEPEQPIELKLDYADINAKAEKAIEDAEFAVEQPEETETPTEEPEETPDEQPNEYIDMDKVIEMAPFMSRAKLDEIIIRYNGKCTPNQLVRIAPFLSKECLEKLVVNCESEVNWDTLKRLAPFLRKETVDALTAAAAKGEKYTNELSRNITKGIKKLYNIGDQIYHEVKVNIKKAAKQPEPAVEVKAEAAPAVDRVAAARARIFERALAEDKFDWIGEHMEQLEDEALKDKIAQRAKELDMHDWLNEYMDDYVDEGSIDDALLSGNWDFVAEHLENASEDARVLIADTAATEGRWDWLSANLDELIDIDDVRELLIDRALANNPEWLAANIEELEPGYDSCAKIIDHFAEQGNWNWLMANIDSLDAGWTLEHAIAAHKAGCNNVAVAIIESHLSEEDLSPVVRAAIENGQHAFAMEIAELSPESCGPECVKLAKEGHLKLVAMLAELFDEEVIAELLDVATEQGDWDMIDQLNELL